MRNADRVKRCIRRYHPCRIVSIYPDYDGFIRKGVAFPEWLKIHLLSERLRLSA